MRYITYNPKPTYDRQVPGTFRMDKVLQKPCTALCTVARTYTINY